MFQGSLSLRENSTLSKFSPVEAALSLSKGTAGRRNWLNAWKSTWTSEIGLVLWQCFRPSTSTHAKLGRRP